MRNLIYSIIVIFLINIFFTPSIAQEDAKYNFGSSQPTHELSVSPGFDVSTKIYFYNVFGNRITHITLSAGDVPEGWKVTFDPSLHTVTVNVSGIVTTIDENLNVEPSSQTFETKPETTPEGIEYISSPIGYIGAKPVLVTIFAPENEQVGTSKNITISAVASWLGQTGSVAIKQNRNFDYTIDLVPATFEEKVIEVPTTEAPTQPAQTPLSRITGFFIANPAVTVLGAVVTVLLGIIVYLIFFRIL